MVLRGVCRSLHSRSLTTSSFHTVLLILTLATMTSVRSILGEAEALASPSRSNKIYIGCNWKCSIERPAEADQLIEEINAAWTNDLDQAARDGVELSVHPPYVFLDRVRQKLHPDIAVGSQNLYDASSANSNNGNNKNTGATTQTMLSGLGVTWVLLGHSDRRNNLGETDSLIAEKAQKVLTCDQGKLRICLTLGELGSQRESGETEVVLKKQLSAVAEVVPDSADAWSRVVLAYEPVWAVGEGATPCPPEEAQRIHKMLRNHIRETVSPAAAAACRITYTGSVNEENAAAYAALSEVEGFVLGRAGLDATKLSSIIRTIVGAKRSTPAKANL